ncbi:MAG: hypothetical protein WB440_09850 [Steroidobacteraceae bacterium]|jgi:Zn-dependent M32 family carboxypeptidase
MSPGPLDPSTIPILTDAVEDAAGISPTVDLAAIRSAVLAATFELADSLIKDAARDIESSLFERVLERLHAQLPQLIDRVLREQASIPESHG